MLCLLLITVGMKISNLSFDNTVGLAINGVFVFGALTSVSALFYYTERRMEMKKVISLILALVMCFALCACEKKTQSDGETATTQIPSETVAEESNENKIEFPEPLLLAEHDHIRVELVDIFENDSVKGENNVAHKFLSLKCSNTADYEISVTLRNLSIDGVTVGCIYYMSEPSLLPGETTTFFLYIHDGFYNGLDSLEELFKLKGRFYLYSEGNISEEIPFSIEDARLS